MQLDLFNSKTSAIVCSFPLHRRVNMIRKIAAALDARSYRAGQRYWSMHVAQERKRLERLGVAPKEIDAEISRSPRQSAGPFIFQSNIVQRQKVRHDRRSAPSRPRSGRHGSRD
ncbi:hypothetical protein AJ88_45720 [Mesorhizobium amorphae CCBAU 01583]|nr:hypothetical protein AJ88_45720 [Mesorhizobium amorphae CCBAU 01583]